MEAGNLSQKIKTFLPILNEAQRRIYLASEAEYLGRGGITTICQASGVSRVTITNGIKELDSGNYYGANEDASPRIRNPGGGRKKLEETQPGIKEALESVHSCGYGVVVPQLSEIRLEEPAVIRQGSNLKVCFARNHFVV